VAACLEERSNATPARNKAQVRAKTLLGEGTVELGSAVKRINEADAS
jgi:hypothetical protein